MSEGKDYHRKDYVLHAVGTHPDVTPLDLVAEIRNMIARAGVAHTPGLIDAPLKELEKNSREVAAWWERTKKRAERRV